MIIGRWGKISFACSAAVFVLEEQDLAEGERDEVMKNSSAIAYVPWNPILASFLDRSPYSHHEFIERHSQQNSYTGPTGGTNVKIGHITTDDLSKLLPSDVDATARGSLGSRVVNQTYRVRNPVNNRVTMCTVVDFGDFGF
jgi:hypothetical protein